MHSSVDSGCAWLTWVTNHDSAGEPITATASRSCRGIGRKPIGPGQHRISHGRWQTLRIAGNDFRDEKRIAVRQPEELIWVDARSFAIWVTACQRKRRQMHAAHGRSGGQVA